MKSSGVLFCLFLFCFAIAAHAEPLSQSDQEKLKEVESYFQSEFQEEDYYRNDELLVTATGSQVPVYLAPSVATVITEEEIEAIGATTLDEILETVPGLHVTPSTSWLSSIWSIRGIHATVNPHVLMLINGVPFTSNYTGDRSLGYQMPSAMISRVEVIRGPGSALHGADAFSGVVNVITKDNYEIDGNEAGVRVGSFDTYDVWAQHGGQYRGWDVALGMQSKQTEGDAHRTVDDNYFQRVGLGATTQSNVHLDDPQENLDGYLKLRKGDFTMNMYGTLQERGNGPGAVQAITYGGDIDAELFLADFNYKNDHLLTDWTFNGQLTYTYMHADAFLQLYPPSHSDWVDEVIYTSEDTSAKVTASYDGFRNHNLFMGTGIKFYNFEPDQYRNIPAGGNSLQVTSPDVMYIDRANRRVWHTLIQDEWVILPHWILTAGVRYDNYSDFGSTTNPRAALVWETRHDLTTKLMYGSAFRAPSFAEQGIKNNGIFLGSETIKPEEIETYELAFDYQPSTNLRAKLNFFSYKAKELIEYVGALPQVATNFGEQEGSGFEFEVDWEIIKSFQLNSNFAYQRSKNKKTDATIKDAPAMQLYVNPQWSFKENWSINGQYLWIAGRQRANGDDRPEISDYDLINLNIRRKNIANHFDFAIGIKNLFNEDVREPSLYNEATPQDSAIPYDYPMNSRSFWAELTYIF